MSRVDELPADQRAALSLLLRQRKSYAEVAGLLGIPERAVHDRAHAALAILAPREAKGLDPARRAEISDYLLGQQATGERLRTRTLLARDAGASVWAIAAARELAPLGGELPELPAPPGAQIAEGEERLPLAQVAASAPPSTGPSASAPSSRRGGAILLAALFVAAIVAVIVITSGGGSSGKTDTTTTTGTSALRTKNEGTFPLHSPAGSRSTGKVEILSEEGKRAFFIQAEHIPASKGFFYAVWLYNSPTSALPLSKSPPVGKSHKLAGAALLPSNASSYKEILLTRETKTRPTHPGHIVLRGRITIG